MIIGIRALIDQCSVEKILLTLIVSRKNVSYIGEQLEEHPLHWWSVGRIQVTFIHKASENIHYIGGQGKNSHYSLSPYASVV